MITNTTFSLSGKHGKSIYGDLTFLNNRQAKPILIFCHGYKGFKDWGAWQLIAKAFAEAGFCFVKFNFSHNGVKIDNPTEFTDLDAFGNDNYTKQLDDLNSVIDFFEHENEFSSEIDFTQLALVGHSRGGGIVLLQANEDVCVKQVITWAGVSDFGIRFPKGKKLEDWKNQEVYYIVNGRTKQKMPHFIQFYEDFLFNQKQLHIKTAVKELKKPLLIVHGTNDDAVQNWEAEAIFNHAENATIKWIANANHVFGMSHPWQDNQLPSHAKLLSKSTIAFLQKNNPNI